MKSKDIYILTIIIAASVVLPLFAQEANENIQSKSLKVHFTPIDIYIDSGSEPLAAYQFELITRTGQVKIVGVEGGENKAFASPPYYDPAALQHDRIIIAAFNTSKDLPKGKTRVATLHMQIVGDTQPQYEIKLTVAADANGKEIPAKISFKKGGVSS
jgi:hypothetical protein